MAKQPNHMINDPDTITEIDRDTAALELDKRARDRANEDEATTERIANTEAGNSRIAEAQAKDAQATLDEYKKVQADLRNFSPEKPIDVKAKADLPTKRTYKVKQGDNLSTIAARNKTTVAELAKRNNIKDVNKIMAGATLDLGEGEPTTASVRPSKPAAKPTPKPKSKTQPKKPVSTPTAMPSILDMPDDKVESMPIPKATPQPKPTPAPAKPKQKETWGAYKLRQLIGSAPPKGVEPYK